MQTKLGVEAWEHTTFYIQLSGLRNPHVHKNILEVLLTEPSRKIVNQILNQL